VEAEKTLFDLQKIKEMPLETIGKISDFINTNRGKIDGNYLLNQAIHYFKIS
jgi:hypothetical protein